MTDTPPPSRSPAPKKSPVVKLMIGCGCLGSLLILGVLGTVFYYGSKIVKTDPADISALYSQLTLGAEVPEGFKTQMGMDWSEAPVMSEDFMLALLISDDGYSISAMLMPASIADNTDIEVSGGKVKATISETLDTCKVGDADVGLRRIQMTDEGGTESAGYELTFPPDPDNSVLRIVFTGPQNNFDKSRFQAFFATLPGAVPATLQLTESDAEEGDTKEEGDTEKTDKVTTEKTKGK